MVRVITDSACDLPKNIIEQYQIDVVPMGIIFGEEAFLDGVDLSIDDFYSKLEQSEKQPTTAQPSVDTYMKSMRSALDKNDDAIVITLSSGISGTFQSALMARSNLPEEKQEKVTVFDSLRASLGQGLLVFEAAKMASAGANTNDIIHRLEDMRSKLSSEFTLKTLEYLIKGGRLSKIQGTIGSILDIKPILHFDDLGKIVQKERIRGRKKSVKRLVEIMEQTGQELSQQTVAISHSKCFDEAEWLAGVVKERFAVKEIIIGEMSPTIGTHTGPGCLSLSFLSN